MNPNLKKKCYGRWGSKCFFFLQRIQIKIFGVFFSCIFSDGGGLQLVNFFTKNPNLKIIDKQIKKSFSFGGGGARVSDSFYKEFKSKVFFSDGRGGGGGD